MSARFHRATLAAASITAAMLTSTVIPIVMAAQSSPAPVGPGSLRPAPPSGKFRVTINGFKVITATRDDLLGFDGVGDEVYASATVIVLDSARGLATPLATVDSRVYGEARRDITNKAVFPNRAPAGTGVTKGGLLSGNEFPPKPWKRSSPPSPDALPLEVWCGTLTQGQNAVIVAPSIWEWDGFASNLDLWITWANKVATDLTNNKTFRELLGAKAMSIVDLGTQVAFGAAMSLDSTGLIGGERDRPIGVRKSTTKPKAFDFVPQPLIVNYATADFSTRESAAGSIGGTSPGTFLLQYVDDPFYQGKYTLYVQVERIDGGKCAHEFVPATDFGGKAPPKP